MHRRACCRRPIRPRRPAGEVIGGKVPVSQKTTPQSRLRSLRLHREFIPRSVRADADISSTVPIQYRCSKCSNRCTISQRPNARSLIGNKTVISTGRIQSNLISTSIIEKPRTDYFQLRPRLVPIPTLPVLSILIPSTKLPEELP